MQNGPATCETIKADSACAFCSRYRPAGALQHHRRPYQLRLPRLQQQAEEHRRRHCHLPQGRRRDQGLPRLQWPPHRRQWVTSLTSLLFPFPSLQCGGSRTPMDMKRRTTFAALSPSQLWTRAQCVLSTSSDFDRQATEQLDSADTLFNESDLATTDGWIPDAQPNGGSTRRVADDASGYEADQATRSASSSLESMSLAIRQLRGIRIRHATRFGSLARESASPRVNGLTFASPLDKRLHSMMLDYARPLSSQRGRRFDPPGSTPVQRPHVPPVSARTIRLDPPHSHCQPVQPSMNTV